MSGPAVATRPLVAITSHLRPHAGLFARVVAVAALSFALTAGAAVLSVAATAAVLEGDPAGPWIVALAVVVVALGWLSWTDSWLSHVLAYRVIDTMRRRIHAALARLAPLGLGRRRSGATAAAAMSDAEQLEWFFAHTVAQVVAGVTVAVAGAGVALACWGWPGLVVAAGQAALVALPITTRRIAAAQGERLRSAVSDLSAVVVEGRQSARELVLLDRVDAHRDRVRDLTVAVQRRRRAQSVRLGLEQAGTETVLAAVVLGVLVLMADRVAAGSLDATVLPVAVALAGAACVPAVAVGGALARSGEMAAAATRVTELVAAPERPAPVSALDASTPAPIGTLELREARLRYPGADGDVLAGISLTVTAGEHVAVVGVSGAGKTSLLHVLVRLVDADSGRLVVDGVDVVCETPAATRRRINLVAQHPHVFRATVAENLRIADADASDARLWEVLEQVELADHVRSLPDGLQSLLAEHGATWSGGQRQRLGLARGVLADPGILVLDEPTAHLDPATESALLDTLATLRAGRTTIVASHRASTIARSDRVLLVADGTVVATGPHDRLLAEDARYRAVLAAGPTDLPTDAGEEVNPHG